jgi:hypothetical protein
MPNWCLNNVTINHDDPTKLNELLDAYKRGELMEHFLPTPKDENGELDKDWYDWRVGNWGTKWDVGGEDAFYSDNPEGLVLSFDSAWSPPVDFYQFLKDEHGFDIRASYWEPGLAFCGDWIDGMDDYYEGEWHDYPQHLIDEYNMVEFYEEDEVV